MLPASLAVVRVLGEYEQIATSVVGAHPSAGGLQR